MRFACEQCQTKYTIPDERVRGKILKIRCKNCNCQITISEGGVRTARPVESAGGDTIIPTKNMMAAAAQEEGGDSTMIGGMADFFGGPGGQSPPTGKGAVDEWYISVDGTTAGPMPLQELAQSVVSEEARPGRELFVWREGLGEWLPPAEVEDVKQAVHKERRVPAPKPVSAVKPALAPRPQPQLARPAMSVASVGASLLDEGGDGDEATQIGSLSMPLAPPATKPERSDLALEAVDFDVVTDLPAPPKPQPKPAAPPPKPKGPPAFKPPPFPGAGAGPKAPPPKSVPPADTVPNQVPGAPDGPSGGPLRGQHDESPSANQPLDRPTFSEEATGALTGDALDAALQPKAPIQTNAPQDGFPMGSSQPPMDHLGQMGQMGQTGQPYGDMAGAPAALGAAALDDAASLGPAKKPSPVVMAGLAAVILIGLITTIWVVVRPSKPAPPKQEIVDAGPPVDAMPSVAAKAAEAAEKDKLAKAKKDDLLGITTEQRDALFEKNQKALTGCFNKALKKSPKLAGTRIQVEVTISAKGKTDTVDLSSGNQDVDGKLGKCLQKSIKRWKFAKHADKTAYQIKFALPVDG